MKKFGMVVAGALALAFASAPAWAADITVLSSTGIQSVVLALQPKFEKATGNKLLITFDTSNALKAQIDGGKGFDVAILTPGLIEDLIKSGKVAPSTSLTIARAGLGIAVKAGAKKPDIRTVGAFKQALLKTKSIAYTTAGQSGIAFAAVIEKLGIADQIKAKAKTIPGGPTGALIVSGDATMAVQLIPELKAVKGVSVVGPFPAELQTYVVLTGGIGAQSPNPAAAQQLLQYLTSPKALPTIKAKGLQPG
jgi:molybdate transport system substrate-binding protein